jgi:hypothetical protein
MEKSQLKFLRVFAPKMGDALKTQPGVESNP